MYREGAVCLRCMRDMTCCGILRGEIKNNAHAMSLYGGILQRKAEKHDAGCYKFSGISFSTQ